MEKKKVLFICVHNSARSQMAAAFLTQLRGDEFEAQSAGLEPGSLNPLVVDAMREVGFDISRNKTQRVFDVWKSGQIFEYVITVCSEAEAQECPIFPASRSGCTGPFPIQRDFKAATRRRLNKPVRSVRPLGGRSKGGANLHALNRHKTLAHERWYCILPSRGRSAPEAFQQSQNASLTSDL